MLPWFSFASRSGFNSVNSFVIYLHNQWHLDEQLTRTEVELAILAKEVTDTVTHVVAGVFFYAGAAILARQALTLVVSCGATPVDNPVIRQIYITL